MGIACGTQVTLCEYPIRFDTYTGCSHACQYCFAKAKTDITKIVAKNPEKALRAFIEGKRSQETRWCDWAIPLHWGGLSDPFQPAERSVGVSLRCLEIFAETGYPVIISTKGKLIAEEPYLSVLRRCNAVVQISMVCSSYDCMELGAPKFEERMKVLDKLQCNCKRTIVRAQPYITDVRREFVANLARFAEVGVYGVTVEGMKFKKKKPGLVRVGGDFCYRDEELRPHYEQIRDECKRVGLAFFCAENRLRAMGDSTAFCGAGDLPGFAGNAFNCVSLLNGSEAKPTERMKENGTGGCFKSLYQVAGVHGKTVEMPFATHMVEELEKMRRSK